MGWGGGGNKWMQAKGGCLSPWGEVPATSHWHKWFAEYLLNTSTIAGYALPILGEYGVDLIFYFENVLRYLSLRTFSILRMRFKISL